MLSSHEIRLWTTFARKAFPMPIFFILKFLSGYKIRSYLIRSYLKVVRRRR